MLFGRVRSLRAERFRIIYLIWIESIGIMICSALAVVKPQAWRRQFFVKTQSKPRNGAFLQ